VRNSGALRPTILRAKELRAMTVRQWWKYVREDRLGFACLCVVALASVGWALATCYLPD
jgi:hypothetical protein